MFRWSHEFSIELNFPLQKVWEFGVTPSNWPKWMEKIESCHFEGELKAGSVVKGKVKSRLPQDIYMQILVTEVKPYEECKLLIKVPLFTQENTCTLQEISSEKTRIIISTCVKSLLTPFMKSFYSKKIGKAKSNELKLFLAAIEDS